MKLKRRHIQLSRNKQIAVANLAEKMSRSVDPIVLDLAMMMLNNSLTQTEEDRLLNRLKLSMTSSLLKAINLGTSLATERMKLILAVSKKLERKSMTLEEMLERQTSLARKQAANGVKGVYNKTKKKIKDAIEEAMGKEEGFTNRDLNSQLYDLGLTDKSGNLLEGYRIDRIVRTEVHAIATQTEHESVDSMAKDVGIVMVKIWSSAAFSLRTRPTHVEADGQVRDMDEPFDIGDAKLMFPGDPAARDTHPEEVINCRCNVLYEPKAD